MADVDCGMCGEVDKKKGERNASVIIVHLRAAQAEKNDKIAEDVTWTKTGPLRNYNRERHCLYRHPSPHGVREETMHD